MNLGLHNKRHGHPTRDRKEKNYKEIKISFCSLQEKNLHKTFLEIPQIPKICNQAAKLVSFLLLEVLKEKETWLFVEGDGKEVRRQWMTLEIPLTKCPKFPGDSRIPGA